MLIAAHDVLKLRQSCPPDLVVLTLFCYYIMMCIQSVIEMWNTSTTEFEYYMEYTVILNIALDRNSRSANWFNFKLVVDIL